MPGQVTPTRVLNPNAPRIEFFTTDSAFVAPGEPVTLFWSTRNVRGVAIYQLDRLGDRTQVWNEEPDGTLIINTSPRDRGQLDFLLSIGEGALIVEQIVSVPLACPVQWFFGPPPNECPNDEVVETLIIEQGFERGRMVYIGETDLVYTLFNDGLEPGWVVFENLYDPNVHPERDDSFEQALQPGFFQPIGELGFVWRNNDTVRNRLGVGIQADIRYDGFTQSATLPSNNESVYISSTSGTVLQLLDNGDSWQIISLPQE